MKHQPSKGTYTAHQRTVTQPTPVECLRYFNLLRNDPDGFRAAVARWHGRNPNAILTLTGLSKEPLQIDYARYTAQDFAGVAFKNVMFLDPTADFSAILKKGGAGISDSAQQPSDRDQAIRDKLLREGVLNSSHKRDEMPAAPFAPASPNALSPQMIRTIMNIYWGKRNDIHTTMRALREANPGNVVSLGGVTFSNPDFSLCTVLDSFRDISLQGLELVGASFPNPEMKDYVVSQGATVRELGERKSQSRLSDILAEHDASKRTPTKVRTFSGMYAPPLRPVLDMYTPAIAAPTRVTYPKHSFMNQLLTLLEIRSVGFPEFLNQLRLQYPETMHVWNGAKAETVPTPIALRGLTLKCPDLSDCTVEMFQHFSLSDVRLIEPVFKNDDFKDFMLQKGVRIVKGYHIGDGPLQTIESRGVTSPGSLGR